MQANRYWTIFSLVVVSVFAAGQINAAQQAESQPAKLSGRVLSLEGKPLTDAVVSLMGPSRQSARTDANGQYNFLTKPGTYRIEATRIGYVTAMYKTEDSESPFTPVTVEAGQQLSNLDVRLARGGVITGQILYEDGDPAIGEQVLVISREKGAARIVMPTPFHDLMFTNDLGRYRIFGLPSGKYCIGIKVGQRMFGQEEQLSYYPSVSSLSQAVEVTVNEGTETSGIDFRVKSGPAEVVKIVGRITRADTGEPMSGIMVSVFQTGDNRGWPYRSDARGYYETRDLMPGKYKLEAKIYRPSGSEEELLQPLAQEVNVERGSVEQNFEFGRPGQISGRILIEGGKVPANVTSLSLSPEPIGGQFNSAPGKIKPNQEGQFVIKSLPHGIYRLGVELEQTPYFLKSIVLDEKDVQEDGVPVEWGRETQGVLLILSDVGATLKGQVAGKKGPIVGMPIALIPVSAMENKLPDSVFRIKAVTDQRGRFQIEAIPPGKYFAFALTKHSPDGGPDEIKQFLGAHSDQLQTIELKEKESKEITITPVVSSRL